METKPPAAKPKNAMKAKAMTSDNAEDAERLAAEELEYFLTLNRWNNGEQFQDTQIQECGATQFTLMSPEHL